MINLSNTNANDTELNDILSNKIDIEILDISKNQITNLKCLSGIRDLMELHASNNSIEECFDFVPRHCKNLVDDINLEMDERETAWDEGDYWVGSVLERVDLSRNCISQVVNLEWHTNLRELNISHNKITSLNDFSCLKWLEILNISNNQLECLEKLGSLENLHTLIANNNSLSHVAFALKLPELSVLHVQNNTISNIAGVRNCTKLSTLLAANNNIGLFHEIELLKNLESLSIASFEGNPMLNEEDPNVAFYRRRVLYRLPQIENLDGLEVSPEEIVSARNLYGEDLDHRKRVFGTVFPGKPFLREVSPFKDPEKMADRLISNVAARSTGEILDKSVSQLCSY